MSGRTPLRRELLAQLAVLFGGAMLLAGVGLAVLLPVLEPGEGILFILVLVVADLLVLFAFGRAILGRLLLEPMERLAGDAMRIADGDYEHRVQEADSLELRQIQESVNAMADRLIAHQAKLAENVESLDRTNRELIEARDQVIHTARLASVGTLAAGIAHEVGNPLGAIMAYVDVARGRAERAGADTELLTSVRAEAERIDRIVRSLLDYARPKKGEAGATPPAEVLMRVRDLLENQGKLDEVEDVWRLEEPAPDVVMEGHQLEQVMVNLLLNALDALEGREDPRIEVELYADLGDVNRLPPRRAEDPPDVNYMHRRRISRDDGGRGIDPVFTASRVAVIQVSDNGPGIPDEDLDRVFDPFYTTKEPGRGTGLGLSICARLIDGMGGRIRADRSRLGGACFTIRLPGVTRSGGETAAAATAATAQERA